MKSTIKFERYDHMALLIIKYVRGQLNRLETENLNQLLDSDPGDRAFLEEMKKEDWLETTIGDFQPMPPDKSFNKTISLIKKKNVIIRRRIITAAAVFLTAVIGIYLLNTSNRKKLEYNVAQNSLGNTNINHATLTLSDGTTVDLDSVSENSATTQGNYIISKDSSALKYTYHPASNVSAVAYNTLATSKGRHYAVILPDGSKAWLNAASSLKYPVTDTGRIRRVEMTGEVYFEVHADPDRPFIVSANGADIKAVGTHFNVTAYVNENKIQTDLLEGKVDIKTANRPVTHLIAGQSATIIPGKSISMYTNTKINDATAWKDDLFVFDAASVPTIMRELSRWYDIEVSYIDTPTVLIDARINKKNTIKDVLTILEGSKMHTTIEGNKVRVSSPEIK